MAKGNKIKPVNPHSSLRWTELLVPDEVDTGELPAKAGLYMVVACDGNGTPICLPGQPRGTQMPGVVYIGMTGKDNTLKKRFAAVVRAWRTKRKWKEPPHGSRRHYDADPAAQNLFAVSDVRLRYSTLPTDPKTDRPEVVAYAAKQGMTPDEWRTATGSELTGDKLVADSEANAIQSFKRQYGYIPMLNRREEGKGDHQPSDKELGDFLKNT